MTDDLISRAAAIAVAERAELDWADPSWTLEQLRALPAAQVQAEPVDNPSVMACAACRSVGMWHCSDPVHCGDMHLRADRSESALRAVMPTLRAYAEDLIRCVSIRNDPATISGSDWRDIADVLDAVSEAERVVGRPDDEFGPLLNPVLDARSWEAHQ